MTLHPAPGQQGSSLKVSRGMGPARTPSKSRSREKTGLGFRVHLVCKFRHSRSRCQVDCGEHSAVHCAVCLRDTASGEWYGLGPGFLCRCCREILLRRGGVGGYKLEVSMPSKIAGSRLRVRGHRSQPSSQQLLVRASFRNSFGGFTREPGTLLKCHSQIVLCLVFPSYAHFVAFFGFLVLCPNRDWHMLLWPAQSCRVRPSAQEDHAFDPRLLHKLPSELGD